MTAKKKIIKKKLEYNCESCGLWEQSLTPKMEGLGLFEEDIMIIGEAPGALEDKKGVPFIGRSGKLIRDTLADIDWDLDRDFFVTNVVQCRPPENKLGSPKQKELKLKSCRARWQAEIRELKPRLIILLGGTAMEAVLGKTGIIQYRGFMIPSKEYHTIVCPTYHPSHILRDDDSSSNDFLLQVFKSDIKKFLNEGLDRADDIDSLLDWRENEDCYNITTMGEFKDVLSMCDQVINLDFETNGIAPYSLKTPKILTCSITFRDGMSFCFPIDKGDYWSKSEKKFVLESLVGLLESNEIGKIFQNVQFECMWSDVILGCKVNKIIADTMIDAHILDPRGGFKDDGGYQKGTTSQAFQVFTGYGFEYKGMVNQAKLEFEPDEKVFHYNNLDTKYGMRLYLDREPKMVGMEKARRLFTDGQTIFQEQERIGVRVDLKELEKQDAEFGSMISCIEETILDSDVVRKFESKFDKKFNLGKNAATKDIKKLLFEIMKVPILNYTKKGNPSLTKVEMIEYAKTIPLCTDIMRIRKLGHHKSTYLEGTRRKLVGDRVHPSTNLHLVSTQRSSMSEPNLQNIPIRDAELKTIRKIFLPDEGHIFGEVDYKQLEVGVAAMYSRDPVLADQLNTGFDMHQFWGNKLYMLKECSDEQRYAAKNRFVFPEFYGSYYGKIYESFEDDAEFKKLFKTDRGRYSAAKAERYLKECEAEFWKTYKVYRSWRDNQLSLFASRGYTETFWKFRRFAPLRRNEILNTPIQGQAFHLLLDAMIKAHWEMKARHLSSRIAWEIHDAMVLSIAPPESEEVQSIINEKMTGHDYDFINIPLKVDWKFSDTNWYEMKKAA